MALGMAAATVLAGTFLHVIHDLPPIRHPESTAHVWRRDATRPNGHTSLLLDDFRNIAGGGRTFGGGAAVVSREGRGRLAGGATYEVSEALVSGGYFALAGRAPIAGAVLAWWGQRLLAARIAPINPILAEAILGSTGNVILAVAGIALVSLPIACVAPALFASGAERRLAGDRNPTRALGRGRYGAFDALLFVQVSLGAVLVIVVAMFTSMVREIRIISPIFPAGDVLVATMSGGEMGSRPPASVLRQDEGVAFASRLPAAVTEPNAGPSRVASRAGERDCAVTIVRVTPNYFDVVGIRTERRPAAGSAIASENAARRCWAGSARDAWAVRAQFGSSPVWIPIAAVASDGLGTIRGLAPPANVYVVDDQHWDSGGTMVTRRAAGGAHAFDRTSAELGPSVTVSAARAPQDLADEQARQAQLVVELLALVAGVALVIGIGGLYASLANGVAIRRREIGVRLALGAGLSHVLRAVTARAAAARVGGGDRRCCDNCLHAHRFPRAAVDQRCRYESLGRRVRHRRGGGAGGVPRAGGAGVPHQSRRRPPAGLIIVS